MKEYLIPEGYARTQAEVYGEAGAEWVRQLPALLDGCARRWSLTIEAPFPLSYNYVAPAARANGEPVVLKVCFPAREFNSEASALTSYAGHGMARLLDAELSQGLLLLERLLPGTRLRTLPGDEATVIAIDIMRQLWRPPPAGHALIPLDSWVAGIGRLRAHFGGTTGPLPERAVDRAERLMADLLASPGEAVVLHGDLHHDNILAAQRQPWLAIDPKGLLGDAAFDTCAWIHNAIPEDAAPAESRRIAERCIALLADGLGIDRERIRAWAEAQAVLSGFWMVEDHGRGWEPALATAEMLASLDT